MLKVAQYSFSNRVARLAVTGALMLLVGAAQAQTVYDSLVNTEPSKLFVINSGSESQYVATDIASNLATRKKGWKIGDSLKERVIKISYADLEKALNDSKDKQKWQEAVADANTTLIIVDCARDQGPLPSSLYSEVRRLGGPVPLRPSADTRFEVGPQGALWSRLRAFNSASGSVDQSKLTMVLSAESLADLEAIKSRLSETVSEDRPPIYPDRPFDGLADYPIAVLPIRMGAIDPKLQSASGYISERLASLVSALGMKQVERGSALDALRNEQEAQERGDYTSQEGQTLGSQLGADIVATGVIRKLELTRGGNMLNRFWNANIEMSIKLLAVKTGDVLYDTGAIRGTARTRGGLDLSGTALGKDALGQLAQDAWGGLESDAVRAADRAMKNGLFTFEMGLRDRTDEVARKLGSIYPADRNADWDSIKRKLSGVRFAIRIPETIIRRVVPDPAVETGITRTMTQAGLDIRDPQAVKDAVDDAMVDRLMKGSISTTDRRKLVKSLGAEVLITGEAFAVILNEAAGGNPARAQARTELKVISLRTGRVLAADSMEVTQPAAASEIAGKRSLEMTAKLLSNKGPFWNSLAQNLDSDRKDWSAVEPSPEKPTPPPSGMAKANLNGVSFMVAIAGARSAPNSFLRQLEAQTGATFMNIGATVLDPSRADELKGLAIFNSVAQGSLTNYSELKEACPADVLLVGFVDVTPGARGSAVQVSWKAIWMSDAKLIGTGSEIGFLESADPAEMTMAAKPLAEKLSAAVLATVARNRPQARVFTIEIQGFQSLSQATKYGKAAVQAFPGATSTFRAGTLRLIFNPRGLDRQAIAIRLEQKAKGQKLDIRVKSFDASSIRAEIRRRP